VGKIPEKAVRESVFLTTRHCILSAELTFGNFAHWVGERLNKPFFLSYKKFVYDVV